MTESTSTVGYGNRFLSIILVILCVYRVYHRLTEVHSPFLGGSIPQLIDTLGAMRIYLPFPKIPLCSMTSAVPLTLIPLGFHGSTDTRSSTTRETRGLPLVIFLYLLVLGKISWLWLPTQKYFPSNSNPTGETSGTPLFEAEATLASLWVFR
jgi:hypothetical protein